MQNNKKQKFLWGVVNIGQQTEGDNYNSNWDKWASRGQVPRIGGANNYWNNYSKQHQFVVELGCNSMRLTVEWSRIEPFEGCFDRNALEHYKKILKDLKKKNITTVVGLWHWSVPMWFEEKYGIHSNKSVELFLLFVKYVRDNLGEYIDYVVVLNEPSVYISTSYLNGTRPPFLKNYCKALRVTFNLLRMHNKTFELWKQKYPKTSVGSTFLYNHEVGRDNSLLQRLYLHTKRFLQNGYMIKILSKKSDYIGINYYTSDSFFFGNSGGRVGWHGTNNWHSPNVWKIFAKGLYCVLIEINKKYNKPIIIMENGKPTNSGKNDDDRQQLLKDTTKYMQKAIEEGVNVKGYFHYSLADSYEWDSGYKFKFGLVEINRKTGQIFKRKSYDTYQSIIKNYS